MHFPAHPFAAVDVPIQIEVVILARARVTAVGDIPGPHLIGTQSRYGWLVPAHDAWLAPATPVLLVSRPQDAMKLDSLAVAPWSASRGTI